MSSDALHRALLSALLFCGGCVSAVPIDPVRDTKFTVESVHSVYLLDGAGEQVTKVLERKQTRGGPSPQDQAYDDYFAPNLSPDGTHIACVRVRNNQTWGTFTDELRALQSSEVLIVRVSDRAERVVMSVPAKEPDRLIYRVLAPVWSADGGRVFFVTDRRVWSYSLDEGRLEQIGELPTEYYGHFVEDTLRGEYLRVAHDGTRLFALLGVGGGYSFNDVIVEIDLTDRKLKTLWSGKLSRQSVFDISLPLPEQLSDDSVEALFGSREFPVFAPPVLQGSAFLFLREVQAGSVWKSLGLGLRPHDADRIRGPHDVADVLLALALEFDKPGRKPQMKSADGVFAFQHQALAWNWPPD